MRILYGGSFNPPTIAHLQIMQYLLKEFNDCELIIIPANDFYREDEMISANHRLKMLELTCKNLIGNYIISNFELDLDHYYGTYYTLEHFNHPYFVIGDDQLYSINKWKNYPDVIMNNKFIIIPRNKKDILEFINNDKVLKNYKDHFNILNEFHLIDVSSTMFRKTLDQKYVTKEVYNYIKENKLYEVL